MKCQPFRRVHFARRGIAIEDAERLADKILAAGIRVVGAARHDSIRIFYKGCGVGGSGTKNVVTLSVALLAGSV